MDPTYFSPDILEFIRLLSIHKVRYLIVGGEAVIFYGHARLTGDIDIFYQRTEENSKALYSALEHFWEGRVPGVANYSEFLKKGIIVQFGSPPNRIDLINDISGVIFQNAWPNRTFEEVEINGVKHVLYYIGLDELIENKRKANRYKDLEDLKYLSKLGKK
jgi:predicted nucleotidyltransferase